MSIKRAVRKSLKRIFGIIRYRDKNSGRFISSSEVISRIRLGSNKKIRVEIYPKYFTKAPPLWSVFLMAIRLSLFQKEETC